MSTRPEDDIEATRAALAPTLEATAAILPWLAKPRPQRFEPALNTRWIDATQALADAWQQRYREGHDAVRRNIFALYGVALETADADCLALGEALASAADQLEATPDAPRLLAAISATCDGLLEKEGLEHVTFGERARHFAQRLQQSFADPIPDARSAILDQLFVSENQERVQRMHDALDALPIDLYALKEDLDELEQAALQIELWGIVHLSRDFRRLLAKTSVLPTDDPEQHQQLRDGLHRIEQAIAMVNA